MTSVYPSHRGNDITLADTEPLGHNGTLVADRCLSRLDWKLNNYKIVFLIVADYGDQLIGFN